MGENRVSEIHEQLTGLRARVGTLLSAVGRPGWDADEATSGLREIAATLDDIAQSAGTELQARASDAERMDEILDVLFGMAGMDFTRRATVGEEGTRLDALAASCNMLSEELEASQRAIQERNEQLQAATRAKSQFLANMSHEIRTPLGAMLGFADLLLDPSLSESERLNYALVIRRNGEHLLSVINDILDLSKIEAGKLLIEKVEFSLARVLSDIDSLMRARALEKGLEFEIRYATPVPEVIVSDPTRTRQVLLNLVGNAVKFTEKGAVRVLVSFRDDGAQRLVFEVVDTGVGMSTEAAEDLFQPFHQGDASMSRRFGGSGLGLAICKPLADALGGEITVESEPGRGSTFTFTMAVEWPEGVELTSTWQPYATTDELERESTQAADLLGGHVLLAEDGVDNQVLVTSILRRVGLRVVVAPNGKIAIDRALAAKRAGTPFDLILMDMQMPEVDGYGAASSLREQGYDGPIIALTAHAMAGERERRSRSTSCSSTSISIPTTASTCAAR